TPARGIWIQADRHPWNTNYNAVTDHLVANNCISGSTTTSNGTIGMLFEYDSKVEFGYNNGVRATVVSNSVSYFDFGAFLKSGSNGVSEAHIPLVDVVFHYNSIFDHVSYALFATGIMETADATLNWWGEYDEAIIAGLISTNVDAGLHILGRFGIDTDEDGINDDLDTDDDDDGLTDIEEVSLGTMPDNPDSDDDGMNDQSEIIAGTDPLNNMSLFMFSVAQYITSNSFSVTWTSVTNRLYCLYRSSDLTTGFVAPPLTNIIATQATTTYIDTNSPGCGPYYYRVTVTNSP
ncbi:MAG: hypothetical protein JXN60_09195, partial [Lentisphaerae bacterium]|nr:hypothetical protein [Lentisphaerota bacterium]